MKRLLLIILINLFFTSTVGFSEDACLLNGYVVFDDNLDKTIYLDDEIEKPTIKLDNYLTIKPISGITKHAADLMNKRSALSSQIDEPEYKRIAPMLYGITEKNNYFSFGTLYSSNIDRSSSQIEHMANIYTKLDFKYGSFSTTYSAITENFSDLPYRSIILSPEIKLSNSLSLVDNFQVYLGRQRKRNELVLRYTPHFSKYAEHVFLEFGGGQTFYETGITSTFLKFNTKFKL